MIPFKYLPTKPLNFNQPERKAMSNPTIIIEKVSNGYILTSYNSSDEQEQTAVATTTNYYSEKHLLQVIDDMFRDIEKKEAVTPATTIAGDESAY